MATLLFILSIVFAVAGASLVATGDTAGDVDKSRSGGMLILIAVAMMVATLLIVVGKALAH